MRCGSGNECEVGGCGYETHAENGVLRAPGETRDYETRRGMANVQVAVWLTNSGQAVSSVAEFVMLATHSMSVKYLLALTFHIRLSLLTNYTIL